MVGTVAFYLRRQFDHDTAARDVDGWYNGVGEGQQQGGAIRRRDLDDVAGAEIVHGDHAAERIAGCGDGGKPDQVGVVVFVCVRRREFLPRDIELDAVEALGLIASRDAFQACDKKALGLARLRCGG